MLIFIRFNRHKCGNYMIHNVFFMIIIKKKKNLYNRVRKCIKRVSIMKYLYIYHSVNKIYLNRSNIYVFTENFPIPYE